MRRWRRKSFMISTSKREKKPWREERAKQIVAGQTDWLEAKREREKKRRLSIKGLKSFEKKKGETKYTQQVSRLLFPPSFKSERYWVSMFGYPKQNKTKKTGTRREEKKKRKLPQLIRSHFYPSVGHTMFFMACSVRVWVSSHPSIPPSHYRSIRHVIIPGVYVP